MASPLRQSPLGPLFQQKTIPGHRGSEQVFTGSERQVQEAAAAILHYCRENRWELPENLEGALARRWHVILGENGIALQENSPRKRKHTGGFELTERQREAVDHTTGPMLVRAGPGAGKTRVLTERIKALAQRPDVKPGEILAISFTNTAAEEIKKRLRKGSVSCEVRTFHSLCSVILKEHAASCPKISRVDFSERLERLFKQCEMRQEMPDLQFHDVKSAIAKARLEGKEALDRLGPLESALYKEYRKEMKREKLLDFTDLLVLTRDLLKGNEEVLRQCQERWKYLLVDEFQDTNPLQLELVELLGGHKNLFVVGDCDQAIYGFLGAMPTIFDTLKAKFPCKEVHLLENFRCSGAILRAAQGLLDPSDVRQTAVGDEGEPVEARGFDNESLEAEWVMEEIGRHLEAGVKGSEIAVLFRTNKQAAAFVQAAKIAKIAHTAKRVVDGKEKLETHMPPRDSSPFWGAIRHELKLTPEFLAALKAAHKESQASRMLYGGRLKLEPEEFCCAIRNYLGLKAFKRFNMTHYARLVADFAERRMGGVRATERGAKAVHEPIKIMTIHASKGDGFRVVFLTGLEEGVLPLYRQNPAEEKRLCYVGATRAKERLYLTHARERSHREGRLERSHFIRLMGC